MLVAPGISPNVVNTDLTAPLSTPLISGMAAELPTFQTHRSLDPLHPVERTDTRRWSASSHPMGSVDKAANTVGSSTTAEPLKICVRVRPAQSPIRQAIAAPPIVLMLSLASGSALAVTSVAASAGSATAWTWKVPLAWSSTKYTSAPDGSGPISVM